MSRTRVACLCIFLGLVAVLSSPGCAVVSGPDSRLNVSPVFFRNVEKAGSDREVDAVGPFYSSKVSQKGRSWAVRPLASYRFDPRNNTQEWQFLYPLGKYRLTPDEKRFYFLPIMSSTRDLKAESEGGQERRNGFFPVFWGTARDGESYGGLFPIYGRLRDRFQRDEILFFLWPLYSTAAWENNKKTTILWPILSWTRGGTEHAFRIWPLYGYENKDREYERSFYAWPFFFTGKDDLDTQEPKSKWMMFPLYISDTSTRENKKIVLWPFFNYYHDAMRDYTQWDLPWPIVQFARGEHYRATRVWPFFSKRTWPHRYYFSSVWPVFLYNKEEIEEGKGITTTYRFLLINKSETTVWAETKEQESTRRLWPLFFHKSRRDGSSVFHFPAIIPVEDDGFERNYGPILRIYEYQRDKEGREKSEFLWGLYRRETKKDYARTELSLLASLESSPDLTKVSILQGLFEYRRTPVRKTLRLLYVPDVLIWGESSVPTEDSLPASAQ